MAIVACKNYKTFLYLALRDLIFAKNFSGVFCVKFCVVDMFRWLSSTNFNRGKRGFNSAFLEIPSKFNEPKTKNY